MPSTLHKALYTCLQREERMNWVRYYICRFLLRHSKEPIRDQDDWALGDRWKNWVPHQVYPNCEETLISRYQGKNIKASFGVPVVWRETKSHLSYCLRKGIFSQLRIRNLDRAEYIFCLLCGHHQLVFKRNLWVVTIQATVFSSLSMRTDSTRRKKHLIHLIIPSAMRTVLQSV